jgi:hypothetical protein
MMGALTVEHLSTQIPAAAAHVGVWTHQTQTTERIQSLIIYVTYQNNDG